MRQREEQIEENWDRSAGDAGSLLDKAWVIILVGVLTARSCIRLYEIYGYTNLPGDHTGICIDKGRGCGGDVRGLEPQ